MKKILFIVGLVISIFLMGCGSSSENNTITYNHTIDSLKAIPDQNWNIHAIEKINPADTSFSFVVMGDNRSGDKVLAKIIEEINKDKSVKFTLDNGDLVHHGYLKEYKNYMQIIKKSNVPFIGIIGNHEIPRYDGSKNYEKFFGKDYFSFHTGNSYFIVLDDADELGILGKQLSWLKDQLKESQNYQYRFVFMHVPLYDPRAGEYKRGHSLKDMTNAKTLNDLFDQYHVTMLFCSHIHFYYRGKWHETPFIITGGAGAPLVKFENDGFYNYIKVTITPKAVKYDVVKVTSPFKKSAKTH
ncbi:metallophosphoesterase [Candidatus Sulfidibacterium hydrothermale]|uniref:metallophosphoesterase family protein n=1 Tax=Candidatus Sulfidibacterium hydrothermale TaxID=2875962 RepID=UPI001F0B3F34|nr:metallophosphoesterase [Candidatus Sulfidibacterium hydrothermale]UBM62630.1 metallophosphoesterase [Candidatus Sulfidibacterium hydrothermale]